MIGRRAPWTALLAVGTSAALLLAGPAPAEQIAEPTTELPTPTPGERTPLDRDVPPPEPSKAPTASEWASAREVQVSRQSPRAAACRTTRVREWLRVRCNTDTFAVSLLGGSNDGVAFWIGKESEGRFGEVQLPLRRGDRRVIQLWEKREGEGGAVTIEPGVVVQELWPVGDPAPTVTVL